METRWNVLSTQARIAFEKALNDDFRRPMDVSDEDFIGDGFDGGVKDSDQGK